ncbi:TonB-dependent receptor [Roseovarius sp. LXJ103]|uniref:TonB-dependent receptor plug domain-containing protein n=1 Tax=Roseovarius carneus TaxID=2853164 RepID=UPI000D60395F|nr:TonB-dependent receptor [Roseovarius carneus]MBZ8118609.1 TonB-dependent receptor [Roseovarius carneus]PWE35704.1 TonB-dependent receptor [Pelagicola sp. LXJ1103]
MRYISFAASLAATTAISGAAQAQEPFDLGEIVVSGGLSPVAASSLGRSATVLTAEDIERRDVKHAADLLRALPGVSVSRTGGVGGLTQVRMRGHEGNHTLVLIDGVEVASTNFGEFDFGGLLAADIGRIEVLRGPQSSIYGSQAIGGVISITTKRPNRPGFSGRISTELGSDGSSGLGLNVFNQGPRGELSFSTAMRATGGFDISGTPGGERDGDWNETYNLKGRYFVTDTLTLGGTLRYVRRNSDTDSDLFAAPSRATLVTDTPASIQVQETFGSVYAELETMGGRLTNRLEYSFAHIDRQGTGSTGAKNTDNTGNRSKIAYRGTLALDAATLDAANHRLTFAAEHEREDYKENDPAIVSGAGQLVKRDRVQSAFVLEYQGELASGLDLQASVRHDDNDKFKDFTTYAVGLSYRFPNQTTRLHASFGTGVQNPTLVEQFGFFANFTGNPNLEPEQSRGWDIGIEQEFLGGRGVVDLSYFSDELTNEIASFRNPATGISTPINRAGKSDRKGIELAASLQVTAQIDANLSYTWLDATEPNGAVEVRRPEHELALQVGYALPNDRTRLDMQVRHVAGNFDLDFRGPFVPGARVKLSDYTVVDIGFSHALTDTVQLTGSVKNLLDEDYEELFGYASQGRTAFIGLSKAF